MYFSHHRRREQPAARVRRAVHDRRRLCGRLRLRQRSVRWRRARRRPLLGQRGVFRQPRLLRLQRARPGDGRRHCGGADEELCRNPNPPDKLAGVGASDTCEVSASSSLSCNPGEVPIVGNSVFIEHDNEEISMAADLDPGEQQPPQLRRCGVAGRHHRHGRQLRQLDRAAPALLDRRPALVLGQRQLQPSFLLHQRRVRDRRGSHHPPSARREPPHRLDARSLGAGGASVRRTHRSRAARSTNPRPTTLCPSTTR